MSIEQLQHTYDVKNKVNEVIGEVNRPSYFASIADLQGLDISEIESISIGGYHEGSTEGGGLFVKATGRHNGGTFIDPNRAFPTDWTIESQKDDWFSDSGIDVIGLERIKTDGIDSDVSWFGAIKNSAVYNSTASLYYASIYFNSLGGGVFNVPSGEYTIGKQEFAGALGLGYSFRSSQTIVIKDCTKPVVINMNGVVLKVASGLRFGSFDPVTGDVYNPSMPFVNSDYAADIGISIRIQGNKNVTLNGALELDGNINSVSLGGLWGDAGRQLSAYGLWCRENDILKIGNVYTHHHCLDGCLVGYRDLTETSDIKPTTIVNMVSHYNARQGLSIVGSNNLTVKNSSFNYTGSANFASNPSAGIDIEAESSINRNIVIDNIECVGNSGVGLLVDSGDNADITVSNSKLIGTNNYSIWPKAPRIQFENCTILGGVVNAYGDSVNPDNATKFSKCLFTDEEKYSTECFSSVLLNTSASNSVYNECTMVSTRTSFGSIFAADIKNCKFLLYTGSEILSNKSFVLNIFGSKLNNNTIFDLIENQPVDPYYINSDALTTFEGNNTIVSPDNKLYWDTWSAGAGGRAGVKPVSKMLAPTNIMLTLTKRMRADTYGGTINIYANNAAPTSGEYLQGYIVFNDTPTAGSPLGWRCIASGNPGTWEAI